MEVHECGSIAEDDLGREAACSLLASAENDEEKTYETFDDVWAGNFLRGEKINAGKP